MLQCSAVCGAVCCSVLQCIAVCCSQKAGHLSVQNQAYKPGGSQCRKVLVPWDAINLTTPGVDPCPVSKLRHWHRGDSSKKFLPACIVLSYVMMMIAFVTIHTLVPLIEGLCGSDSISIRVLGVTFTSFALLFRTWKILFDWKTIDLIFQEL